MQTPGREYAAGASRAQEAWREREREVPGVQAIEALYYPHMEFPSVPWVKAALLYWEGLLRIVPDGRMPNDPPEIKQLVEAGVVQNISPAPFRRATADTFGPRLQDLLEARKGEHIDEEWACAGPREPGNLVHMTQIEHVLAKELESRHLMTAAGEWARMSPALTRLYQVTMANEVARQLYVAPMTEHPACDVAATYFAFGKISNDTRALPPDGLQFSQVYMPFPSQTLAATVSIDRLLDIRIKYQRRRAAFRENVQRRVMAIATLPSAEAIRAHLQGLAREMQEHLRAEEQALRAARVKDAWTVLGITAPLTLGSAGTLAGAPLVVSTGAFGLIGLGVLGWYLERRVKHRTEGNYLLALDRDVGGNKALVDMRARMKRLIRQES